MSYNPFLERYGIAINNMSFSGDVRIEGLENNYQYELKRVAGQTGAVRPKYLGLENREFTITMVLNTAEEYALYTALKAQIPPPNGRGLTQQNNYAIPIYHPLLNEQYGIDLVVLKKDVAEEKDPNFLRWTVKLSFLEVPPPPKVVAAKVTGAPVPTQEIVARQSPRQRELDEARQRLGIAQDAAKRQDAVRDAKLEEEVSWSLAP